MLQLDIYNIEERFHLVEKLNKTRGSMTSVIRPLMHTRRDI